MYDDNDFIEFIYSKAFNHSIRMFYNIKCSMYTIKLRMKATSDARTWYQFIRNIGIKSTALLIDWQVEYFTTK